MYTDFHRTPVCGLRRVWIANPVAMSSVIESRKPPTQSNASIRVAWFVPTNMAVV